MAHGLFSWMGAASEGGYLGSDSASFFSAMVSGVAGSCIVMLTADAGIGADLVIQPGQDVHISGDQDSRAGSGSVFIDSCTFYGFLYKARAVQTTACMDQRESSVIRSVQHARLEVLNATFAENVVYEYSDQDPSYTAVICNPASVATCTNALVSWELPNSCSGTTDASMDHIHEGADCRYSNGAALSFICE